MLVANSTGCQVAAGTETGQLKDRENILKRASLALDKTNRKYFYYSSSKDGLFSYSIAKEVLEEEERLDDIRLAGNQIGKRVLLCPIEGDAEHKRILDAIGVKKIPRILPT
jgi:hypothetical protein